MTAVTVSEVAYIMTDRTGRESWRFTPPPFETDDNPVRCFERIYGPRVKGTLKTKLGRVRTCRFQMTDIQGRSFDTVVNWSEQEVQP